MKNYMKFIVAFVGAAAYAAQAAISDGAITGTEAVGILVTGVVALLVVLTPNVTPPADGSMRNR